jgi:hypothetical protein
MATPPTTNQIFEVQGELRVVTPASSDARVQGRIAFTDSARKAIGELKVFGSGQSSYRLILDTASIRNGLSIRTSAAQGTVSEGGSGLPYIVTISDQDLGMTVNAGLNVNPYYTQNGDTSSNLLTVRKTSDSLGSNDKTSLARYLMTNFKAGQATLIEHGTSASGYRSVWGYRGGYTNLDDNYAFLGMSNNSSGTSVAENVKIFRTGNVGIPLRLDAGTISATTYLNLPPPSAGDLLPLTLDKVAKRVGVNQSSPQSTLDVGGEVRADSITCTGNVTGNYIESSTGVKTPILEVGNQLYIDQNSVSVKLPAAQTPGVDVAYYDPQTSELSYGPVPSQDLTPISLDKTNNRVGINIAVPKEALDVDGNVQATGDLVIDGSVYLQGLVSNPTSQSMFYDSTTKLVSYGNTPSPDLLPITLDKTNNRVGINNTTPTQALDVTGSVRMDRLFVKGTLANQGLIFTDTTNNRVGVGTITPATALDVYGTTTTTNLVLTGIASATKTEILYYDPTTKQVSHGPGGSNSVNKTVNTVAYSNPAFNGRTDILSVTPGITGYVRIIATARTTKNSSTAVPNITIYLNSNVIGATTITGSVGSTLYWSLGTYDIRITPTDTIHLSLNYGSGTTVPANTISISTGEAVLTYQVI